MSFNIGVGGAGAAGILAQSIGGGGLFGGLQNTLLTGEVQPITQLPGQFSARYGQGGDVAVSLTGGSAVATQGRQAHAIVAQSLGGGGGIMDQPGNSGFVFANPQPDALCLSGGPACSGLATVSVEGGSLVEILGPDSTGVFAQSRGNNPAGTGTSVRVGQGSVIRAAGQGGIAVYLDSGGANTVSVEQGGTIHAIKDAYVALRSAPGSAVTVQNAGLIRGGVAFDKTSTFNNLATGTLVPVGVVNLAVQGPPLGTLNNAGTVDLSQGNVLPNWLRGNLNNTGRIITATNHVAGRASASEVQGSVRLGGTIEVRPIALANRPATVLAASDGLTVDPGLSVTGSHLFRFEARQTGNALQVQPQPQAQFAAAAAAFGDNRQRVAAHLRDLWNADADSGVGFMALSGIADNEAYGRSLDSLSGQTEVGVATSRQASNQNFVANMFNECPSFEGAGWTEDEASCGWGRVFGSYADQNGRSGLLGYQFSAWTFQAGGQRQVAPNWFLGGSLGYENSLLRGDGGSSRVNGDSLLLGATLRYQSGPWHVAGALDFGYGWYDSRRSVEAGFFRASARGKPEAWQLGTHGRLAYTIPFETAAESVIAAWHLQPRVDLHLNHVRAEGYTETGAAPFNLAVDAQNATTFSAIPTIEVGGRVLVGNGAVLRPFASAGVELIANGDWASTARFVGQPSSRGFRATSPAPDVLGRFTAGIDLLNTTNWDLRVQYTAEVGDGYTAHTGLGRIAYRF